MTPENWEKVKEIFDAISDAAPDERAAVLVDLDGETKTAVKKLLDNHDAANRGNGLLDSPPIPSPSLLASVVGRPRVFEPAQVLAERFEVQRELGHGGMGEVYEAFDRQLAERIAIKTVRFDLAAEPTIVARFKREVQRSRRVTHANVCRVYDLFSLTREDGRETSFLTMELIDGPTLYELVESSGPLQEDEAQNLGLQICAGLGAAHEAGIIHRDLKSGNILLAGSAPNRRVAITDFGLARVMSPEAQTRTMLPMGVEGTMAYLAPELLSGGHATVRSDIYALGVVLFRMIAGAYPFREDPDSIPAAVEERQRPPRVTDRLTIVGRGWDAAIQACLEPVPGNRPETPDAVAQLLTGEAGRSGVGAAARRFGRDLRRRDLLIGAGSAVAIVGAFEARKWWLPGHLTRQDKVLVEEFASPSGPELGRTVRSLFRLSLAHSDQVTLVKLEDIRRALQGLGIGAAPMRGEVARSVAERVQARALLGGEVSLSGIGYKLHAELRDASGRRIAQADDSVVEFRDLPVLVQGAARRLGLLDQVQLAGPQVGGGLIEQLDSNRPDALEMLTAGLEHYQSGEKLVALEFLNEATRLDPQFAVAWAELAMAHIAFGEEDRALEPAGRAYALREKVSGRQRVHAEAIYANARGDYEGAFERWRALEGMYPNDALLHRHLAQGYAMALRPEEELEHTKQAVQLNTGDALGRQMLASAYADNGQFKDAGHAIEQAEHAGLSGPMLALAKGYCFLLQSDTDGAFHWYGEAARSFDLAPIARSYQIRALLLGGRFEEARSWLEADLPVMAIKPVQENKYTPHYWLGQILALSGDDRGAARQAAELAAAETVPSNLGGFREAAELAAASNGKESASEAVRKTGELATRYPSSRSKSFAAYCEGQLAQLRGQPEVAKHFFESAQAFRVDIPNLWALAETLRKQGAFAEALAQYQRVLDAKWAALRFEGVMLWVQSAAAAGLVQKEVGQLREAVANFDLFMRHWGSQRHLPLVRDVMQSRAETLRQLT